MPGSEEEAPVRDKGALCRPFSGLAQSSRGFHTQAQGLPRATFENYYLKAVRQFTFCSQKQSSKKGGEGWRETGRVIVGRAWKTVKGGKGQRERTQSGKVRRGEAETDMDGQTGRLQEEGRASGSHGRWL